MIRRLRDYTEGIALSVLARQAPASRRKHYRRHGLRVIRERWWWQTQFESPALVWRHIWQLEHTAEPNAGAFPEGGARSLVVYMPGHIGDLLLTVPLLRALRDRFPRLMIEWMVGPWVADLARRYGVADRLTEFSPAWFQNRRGAGGPGRKEQVAWADQREPVDVFLSTAPTDLATLFVGRACRPRWWIGRSLGLEIYPVASRQTLVEPERGLYEADDLLRLLHPLGIVPPAARVTYEVAPAERDEARTVLVQAGVDPARRYVVISASAGWPGKQWPVERWAAVADALARAGVTVVLAGGKGDALLVKGLQAAMREPACSLVGATTLPVLAAVLEGGALWLGSDSGGLHLAAAVGTPTVALFGPTNPAKWAPPGPRNRVVRADHDCSGCVAWHPRAPCLQDGACMKTIAVETVQTAAFQQLEVSGGRKAV